MSFSDRKPFKGGTAKYERKCPTESPVKRTKSLAANSPPYKCCSARRLKDMSFRGSKKFEKTFLTISERYKTELCRNWERGVCSFGDACSFAHGLEQLKAKTHVSQSYKTRLCQQFKDDHYCRYGQRCQFLHVLFSKDKSLSYQQILVTNLFHLSARLQIKSSDCEKKILAQTLQNDTSYKDLLSCKKLPIFARLH